MLSHIKILDLSRVLAGPWASQNLADLGAEVIKIERPEQGDDTRKWGPPFVKDKDGNDSSESAYFLSTNRSKKSVTVDITKVKGQEIIKELAKQCDVVIENFKVGGLKKYGLDYESIKEINPQIVYCSITGFGQDGPYKDIAGYDYMIQGMGGLMSITGKDDEPMRVGIPIVDIMTGMYATTAILAALNSREKTGEGEYIDLALLDVQAVMLANQMSNYLISGNVPERIGNTHPNIVPYQAFQTKDDFIILAIGNDRQFNRYCQVIEQPQLAEDDQYKTNNKRVENRDRLVPILQEIMSSKTTEEWLDILAKESIPCGPINNIEEVVNHDQIKHRGMIKTVSHEVNDIQITNSPIKFLNHPTDNISAPPTLGQHTEDVLSTVLSYSSEVISELKKKEII